MTSYPQRIAKVIAASGLCSRREAERWIEEGRVTLNGDTLTSPAIKVTDQDAITVDGKPLTAPDTPRLFMYHKPTGELVTQSDPQGRPTIYDSLPDVGTRLIPVGRLDLNSEGLLLLSTCPTVASEFMHSKLPRVYRVRTFGQLNENQLKAIQKGLTSEGVRYAPAKIELEKAAGRNAWYRLTLTEGKNREIRNLFGHFDIPVNRLIRVAYAGIKIGDLKPKGFKEVPIDILR